MYMKLLGAATPFNSNVDGSTTSTQRDLNKLV